MGDIFDNKVLCNKCEVLMRPAQLIKNGFVIRILQCPKCGNRIYHPKDIEDYNSFQNLKNKEFIVKMRMVGNSYTVSIPREIVNFIHEQEKIFNEMVKLCFEEAGKLSIEFGENLKNLKGEDN
ncbi:hypothetical protein COV15_00085 [Candidatus Woesearchaeota archaeon CG10_big_fil_rev_8_21_14_0_10_34_12]|nr:MAG: hypothetical protein COV15_00085 [Candidatus Woesearchaeota archaeon CG10_big_fil_rev_8_21_14_0_10_34_12]